MGEKNKYYHGTSTSCKVKGVLLPPVRTGNLREDFRKKHQDCVFLTMSIRSAETYAKKACVRFGGASIVYHAEPCRIISRNGLECVCDKARIKEVVNL